MKLIDESEDMFNFSDVSLDISVYFSSNIIYLIACSNIKTEFAF